MEQLFDVLARDASGKQWLGPQRCTKEAAEHLGMICKAAAPHLQFFVVPHKKVEKG